MTYLTPLTIKQLSDVSELIEITQLKGKIKKRCRQRKRDPKKIPRPLNCFLLYRMEKQKQISELCPGANHRAISKIVAKWWKDINLNDKQKYIEASRIAKMEHKHLYPDYKYIPRRKSSQIKKSPKVEDNHRIKNDQNMLMNFFTDQFLIFDENSNNNNNNNSLFLPLCNLPSPFQPEETDPLASMIDSPFYNLNQSISPIINNNNNQIDSSCPFPPSSSFYDLYNNQIAQKPSSIPINNNNNILQHDFTSSSLSSATTLSSFFEISFKSPSYDFNSMNNNDSNNYINHYTNDIDYLSQLLLGTSSLSKTTTSTTATSYLDMLNQPIYDSSLNQWYDSLLGNAGSLCYPDPGYLMYPL